MMMLQPQVTLLDRFVIQQESIPNFMPPLGARQPQMQFNRGADGMTNNVKNVSKHNSQFEYKKKVKICDSVFFLFISDSKHVHYKDSD